MEEETENWEYVGEMGVDSGLCWVGDPCYILNTKGEEPRNNITYDELLDKLYPADPTQDKLTVQLFYKKGYPGLGVCVSTGYGDGMYPVFVKYADNKQRIAEVKVVFIGERD